MKYIQKRTEPQEFVDWKTDFPSWNDGRAANYDDLQNPLKNQVKQSLIEEQGKICCYCGMRIDARNTHIEHLKPQQHCTPEESVDYHNIVASCEGENKKVHCGHNKHNWHDEALFVSPLHENCAAHFVYTYDGKILPCEDSELVPKARETIFQLGLDSEKLNALRRVAWEPILYLEDLTIADIDAYLQACDTPNDQGEFPEYAAAVQSILQVEKRKMLS
ncbi:retron system putative HNH endonuclease [Tumebacillus flagellatus]|uniref:TIGR02646 family protein n=1 Tax=Tumebacillus flagellatus TaxID=1157490 RepID=A0A074LMT6_9BACL|nr:retron system putative HNH endonuclease [Tumebacillus flagellatus]KEO82444.1 hypothetical protein EL26_15305 [Tumebacillus flagellatus]